MLLLPRIPECDARLQCPYWAIGCASIHGRASVKRETRLILNTESPVIILNAHIIILDITRRLKAIKLATAPNKRSRNVLVPMWAWLLVKLHHGRCYISHVFLACRPANRCRNPANHKHDNQQNNQCNLKCCAKVAHTNDA